MKRIAWVVLAMVALCVVSCTPKRDDIQTYWNLTPTQASLSASLHAKSMGGVAYLVAPSGSMLPKLQAGDYVVVDTSVPYSAIHVGMMLVYKAHWLPPESPTVCHWVGAKSGNLWIMDGQANSHYESGSMEMSERDFMAVGSDGNRVGGKVVAIYTTRPKS